MTAQRATAEPRVPLSPQRVFAAAVELADAEGLDAVTMRNVAARLGVEAMSLYHHVKNKEALLDGVVDTLVEEIEAELGGFGTELEPGGWRPTMRSRMLAARQVMLRHKWAPKVVETRTMTTPATLRYMDSLVGIMMAGGFSADLCHHATHALGSLPLGFNQELFAPDDDQEVDTTDMLEHLAPRLPHLVAMLAEVVHEGPDTTLGWCDDQTEFEFAVDTLLEGLDRRHQRESLDSPG